MFKFFLLTQEAGVVLEKEVDEVILPSIDGQRTVLAHHMDLVIPVAAGKMFLVRDDQREEVEIQSGLFLFKANVGKLLQTN